MNILETRASRLRGTVKNEYLHVYKSMCLIFWEYLFSKNDYSCFERYCIISLLSFAFSLPSLGYRFQLFPVSSVFLLPQWHLLHRSLGVSCA